MSPSSDPVAPLSGITVLDLSQVMAGPWAAQLLADLGASVIKIEPPGSGDTTRVGFRTAAGDTQDSAAFRAVNRNKRSISIDLRRPEGQAVLHRLVAGADVLLENYRPGLAQRLGADASTVRAIRPDLIVVSLTGFGQPADQHSADQDGDGRDRGLPPLSQRPGYDLIAQAMTGLMAVTGEPGGEPVKSGVPITDLTAGLYAVIGVLTALYRRRSTGQGDHLRTSLYQAGLSLLVWETASQWSGGGEPGPNGSAHRLLAPYEALRTRDGHLVVAANSTALWSGLFAVLGRPELADDPRFATNADRLAHRAVLAHQLESTLITADTDHWVRVLVSQGIPAAPVRSVSQAVGDPHTLALRMVGTVNHPVAGEHPVLGVPLHTDAALRWPGAAAPLFGEHTDEILGTAGFSTAEITALRDDGVVA